MKSLSAITLAFVTTLAATFVIPTAAEARVKVQHGPDTNFEQYQTYSWADEKDGSISEQWFRDALDRELAEQGLVEVEVQPDLILSTTANLEVETIEQVHRTGPSPSVRPYRWRTGGGIATWTVDSYDVTTGTYRLQLFDTEANEIVLESTASGKPKTNAEKTQKKMAKAASKMLAPLAAD